MTTINVGVQKNVLIAPELAFSIGCQVANTGVTAVEGKKIIPAGTIVGGTNSVLQVRNETMTVTNANSIANAQGVLVNDVDVTAGTTNGSLLISGFVDIDKLPTSAANIVANSAAALSSVMGKITFLKGDAQ